MDNAARACQRVFALSLPVAAVLYVSAGAFLPVRDAIAMTRQLGNARLLVVHGYGHTAFLNPSTYMAAYFLTGALPPKGTVCRQNLPPFPPAAG